MRTLTPVSLPSRTATWTPRSGRRSTGATAPPEALERPLAACAAPARLMLPDAAACLPGPFWPATTALPARWPTAPAAGVAASRVLAAAELNVRLPLTMVTRAAGPWTAAPPPAHPAMTSRPAAPAPARPAPAIQAGAVAGLPACPAFPRGAAFRARLVVCALAAMH